MENSESLTVSIMEAAKLLGIGRDTAYAMVRQGRIPSILMGQRRRVVPRAALMKMLGSNPA